MNVLLFHSLITLGLNKYLCTKIAIIGGYRNKCPGKKCNHKGPKKQEKEAEESEKEM